MKNPTIKFQKFPETYIASIRTVIQKRSQIKEYIHNLKGSINPSKVAGPAFSFTYYVTSVADGDDVEICVPIKSKIASEQFSTRLLPPLEVLRLVHHGPIKNLGISYQKLYQYGRENWYISDEFGREV
jgi:effector-binding domain-containing protein